MTKTALALRHVAFEDCGILGEVLAQAGYDLTYHEAWKGAPTGADPDLLVVLGGPLGVYEADDYPFLTDEVAFVAERLARNRPTIGFCLGSQIMAAALGARVYPGPRQEIGWAPLTDITAPLLAGLAGLSVLHWHGDTFDLPGGCARLASTPGYPNQGFSSGPNILALQFHLEVPREDFEAWLVAGVGQLSRLGLKPADLRGQADAAAAALDGPARQVFARWLTDLS